MSRRSNRWSREKLHRSRGNLRCSRCGSLIFDGATFFIEDPGDRVACGERCVQDLRHPQRELFERARENEERRREAP